MGALTEILNRLDEGRHGGPAARPSPELRWTAAKLDFIPLQERSVETTVEDLWKLSLQGDAGPLKRFLKQGFDRERKQKMHVYTRLLERHLASESKEHISSQIIEDSAELLAELFKEDEERLAREGCVSTTTKARKRRAEEYFPRARQIPVMGLLFGGIAQVWCILRDNWDWLSGLLDLETLKQILLAFVLLVSGLYPIMVVRDVKRNRYDHGYTRRTRAYFFLWGIALVAVGCVMAERYSGIVASDRSAQHVLVRIAREHEFASQGLEAAWRKISADAKDDPRRSLSQIQRNIAPDIRSELGGDVALFVNAKVTEFNHENRITWMVLSILAILAGIVNVVCGWKLSGDIFLIG
jgi:hypothetical protein